MKSLILSLFVLLSCFACKKTEDDSQHTVCDVYSVVSADTNYFPHKKGNYWDYCYEENYAVGNKFVITHDTLINNKCYFISRNTRSSKNGGGTTFYYYIIDSLQNVYYSENYYDTIPFDQAGSIKLIDPQANNGDTIYHSQNAIVILINKNDTYRTATECYHSLEKKFVSNSNSYIDVSNHYYKKGIGEIYFGIENEHSTGFVLANATIH